MKQIQIFNYTKTLGELLKTHFTDQALAKEKYKTLSLMKSKSLQIKTAMMLLSEHDLDSNLYHFITNSQNNGMILIKACIAVINSVYSVDQRNHASILLFKKLKNEKFLVPDDIIFYNKFALPKPIDHSSMTISNNAVFVELNHIFAQLGEDDAIAIFGAWLSEIHPTTQQTFTRCLVNSMSMIMNTHDENSDLYNLAKYAAFCSQSLAFGYI